MFLCSLEVTKWLEGIWSEIYLRCLFLTYDDIPYFKMHKLISRETVRVFQRSGS